MNLKKSDMLAEGKDRKVQWWSFNGFVRLRRSSSPDDWMIPLQINMKPRHKNNNNNNNKR